MPRYVGRASPATSAAPASRRGPRLTGLAAALLLVSTASPAATLVPIGAGLRGPAGAKASVYATGLPTMSAFAFDGRGRLWVTASAANDHTHDGVFLITARGRAPVKVVRGLVGPLGLTWLGSRLYVSSLGRVDAFSGLRGTHFTRRQLILAEPTGHGWNNSIIRAPTGRLVMSISSACDHCTRTSKWSASIVSFRADGSDVRIYASRIRAGYGLAFVPGTSRLLVSMNQRDDLDTRTPGDWLAIVRPGEDWRFPGCYGQGGAACAGVPKPLGVLDKHGGAGAVAVGLGAALVTEWQAGKVQRVTLDGRVSTYLTGFKRPLPLAVAPDGAVIVGDWATGVIYRVAPSS